MEKEIKDVKSVSGRLKNTEEKITKQSYTKDGITRSITVREVENGFVINIEEEGKDSKNNWNWATQTWISKTNPLDEDGNGKEIELSESVSDTIASALKNLKLQ